MAIKPYIASHRKAAFEKQQSNDINVQKIKYLQKILSLNAHTFQEMLWQKSVFNKNLANTSKKKSPQRPIKVVALLFSKKL